MSDAFDLDAFRAADTDEIAINHPVTGEPTKWLWTIAGPGHPATIEQSNRLAREANATQRLKEQAVVNRKKWHEPSKTVDEVRVENVRFFADRVLGWTPARINGQDYPYSRENVVKLLVDPTYGWIFTQLTEFFRDETAFLGHLKTTS